MRVFFFLLFLVSILGLSAPAAGEAGIPVPGGGEVTFWLLSPQAIPVGIPLEPGGAVSVLPGEPIEWSIVAVVGGKSAGLAMFSVDLVQDPGNPAHLDLPAADPPPEEMAGFEPPAGFANPGPEGPEGGYGGRPVATEAGYRDLLQIGGAQNTFGLPGPCFGTGGEACVGQDTEVDAGIGQVPFGQVVAAGTFPAPDVHGTYRFYLAGARANVLERIGSAPEPTVVRPASVGPGSASILVRVGGEASSADGLSAPPALPEGIVWDHSRQGPVRPSEGATLSYVHVGFWWPPFPGCLCDYELLLVEDDGSDDPFAGSPDAVMRLEVEGAEPRLPVTSGLEFGKAYAWRVLGAPDGSSGIGVSPIYRFRIAELPPVVPVATVTDLVPGAAQPGLTLVDLGGPELLPDGREAGAAYDESGRPVFFYLFREARERETFAPFQMLENGRLSFVFYWGTMRDRESVALETTLGGRFLWQNPQGRGYQPHHDLDVFPDADLLVLLEDAYSFPGEPRPRRSDRLVKLDRQTGDELWSWRAGDHYSPLDSFGTRDWTHGNAAFYYPPHDSVYLCARNLNRISRIEIPSGEIVYNMGWEAPSGDVHFGDRLFSFQHAPEVTPEGTMLVYDNGNLFIPRVSRAIEIAFDDPLFPSSAEIVWEFVVREEDGTPAFTRFRGDVDLLPNGNRLVTASTIGTIFEVDEEGVLVRRIRLGDSSSFADPYRSQRIPSLVVDAPGDRDGDQDLDLRDLGELQVSFGARGPGDLPFPDRLSDMDGSGEIDGEDLLAFARWMSGPAW